MASRELQKNKMVIHPEKRREVGSKNSIPHNIL